MLITQLQAVVHHCRKILDTILNNNSSYQKLSEEGITSLIKIRKQQINQLKVDLQLLGREQKDKQQLARYITAIHTEIQNIRKLNAKQNIQKCHLESLSHKNRLKTIDQNERIAQIYREQQIMEEFQLYIENSIENKHKNEELRQQLDGITSSMVKQKLQRNKILKQKQQLVREVKQNQIIVDTKIAFLQNQLSLQQQIIMQITRIQLQQTPYPSIQSQAYQILNREGQAIFNQEPDTDIWERHQIQNVLQKRYFELQKQKRRIGSITKQPIHYTQPRQNHKTIKRRSLNHSADLIKIKKKEVQQLTAPLSPGPVQFISKQRMMQIQKNKRIRSRFTPPKVKPFLIQPIPEETSFSSSKHSILNDYQSFLKEKIKENPSIIKFKRKGNKKRVFVEDNKGVAIQVESFY